MGEYYTIEEQVVKLPQVEADGWILDIGGGGEGIIGLLKGSQVVAIDKNRRELEETSNNSLKIVMDACDLNFLDQTFNMVTAFFAMMYIPGNRWGRIFEEVRRVLRGGGEFLIWDASFHVPASVEREISVVPLKVIFPDGSSVGTGYGCKIHDQDLEDFEDLATEWKFEVAESSKRGETFFLRLTKS